MSTKAFIPFTGVSPYLSWTLY